MEGSPFPSRGKGDRRSVGIGVSLICDIMYIKIQYSSSEYVYFGTFYYLNHNRFGLYFANPTIIESIITASILLIAVENLFHQKVNIWRLLLIFLFGLIHGLGFANAFLSLQIPTIMTTNALVAFNIGMEIAQILIILGLYFLLTKWIK